MSAETTILLMRKRRVLELLHNFDATTAEKAKSLAELGIKHPDVYAQTAETLLCENVIVGTEHNRFYLNQ